MNEPVVADGSAMNTQAEITQAFRDYHSGTFGQIRRAARLRTR
ncbi:hypothetical protein [Streptomyces sp. NBC_01361]